ncbi:Uncharacterised protein [uncultured archaeon]|nr:Uncharacterised protein [uncultured archaeon]
MKTLSFALLALAALAAGVSAQQLSGNFTSDYANRTYMTALAYVNSVNQSGYLIFYPDLTQAYIYLGKAVSTFNTLPGQSVIYSETAQSLAQTEYSRISAYRKESFAIMVVLTVIAAAVLAGSMRKAKASVHKRRSAR